MPLSLGQGERIAAERENGVFALRHPASMMTYQWSCNYYRQWPANLKKQTAH
jgi:hypothetical protein